jgi:hypothetical protein
MNPQIASVEVLHEKDNHDRWYYSICTSIDTGSEARLSKRYDSFESALVAMLIHLRDNPDEIGFIPGLATEQYDLQGG